MRSAGVVGASMRSEPSRSLIEQVRGVLDQRGAIVWLIEPTDIGKLRRAVVGGHLRQRSDQDRDVVANDALRNSALDPAGVVEDRETRGRFGSVEKHRGRGDDAEDHRHHQYAEPEAPRADVLDVFTRRDEERLG